MTVATALRFPSAAWFAALGEHMAADDAHFRKLGTMDAKVGIQVINDDALPKNAGYLLTFETYTLDRVEEVERPESSGADFVLAAPYAVWKEMVDNIRTHGEADLKHTLNYLHFGPLELVAVNQVEADLFFRVNGSLQAFFDGAAVLEPESSS